MLQFRQGRNYLLTKIITNLINFVIPKFSLPAHRTTDGAVLALSSGRSIPKPVGGRAKILNKYTSFYCCRCIWSFTRLGDHHDIQYVHKYYDMFGTMQT